MAACVYIGLSLHVGELLRSRFLFKSYHLKHILKRLALMKPYTNNRQLVCREVSLDTVLKEMTA